MKKLITYYLDSFKGLSIEVWMLSLVILINRIATMVIPFLGVYMTQSLGFSIKDTGLVLSCFGVGAVLGSYLGGKLTDKFGFFKVQAYSFLLTFPIYCILPQLTTVLGLSIGVFILSVVADAFRPANSVALSHFTEPSKITKAFSLNRMAVNLGFSIGPAVGGLLAAYSYDFLFYVNGLGSFFAAVLFIYYFKGKQVAPQARSANFKEESPYRNLRMVLFSVICCLYAIIFFQLLSTLPLYYTKILGKSEIEIGIILGYSGIFIVVFEMILVELAGKKFSLMEIIVLGTLLCGLAFVMLNFSLTWVMAYFSITVLCVSEILAMPYLSTVFVQESNETNRGAYMGMYSLAFSAAHIVSPYLGTYTIEHFGFSNLWWFSGGISLVAALSFYLLMKNTKKREVE